MPNKFFSKSNLPFIMGVGLTIISLIMLVSIPCPSDTQFFGLRIVLGIAIAGLTSILPGYFEIGTPIVRGVGAVGIFLLIYFWNPAVLIVSSDCYKRPFMCTITLNSRNIPKTYPKIEGTLSVRFDSKLETAKIDENGDATFKEISANFLNSKVAISCNIDYWKLEIDSILLRSGGQPLNVSPDTTLKWVKGCVKDFKSTNLSNVTIDVDGIIGASDEQGRFQLMIPLEQQRTAYRVNASKTDYKSKSENFTPKQPDNFTILMEKVKK